ncbi:MAG: anthranilate synthase component I family protein [Oceanicaulis sp.]
MAGLARTPGVEIALDWTAPEEVLTRLHDAPGALLMQGGSASNAGRFSYLTAFPEFTVREEDPEAGFKALRAGFRASSAPSAPGFSGGHAGLLSYDLGRAFERLPRLSGGIATWPALAMNWYGAALVFDLEARTVTARGEAEAAARLVEAASGPPQPLKAGPGDLTQVWDDARYLDAARRAIAYVRAGDVFQVNLSHPFRGRMAGADAPAALARTLASSSPAAFSAYLRLDADHAVVTNSPERFVKLDADGRVETRPIKGTAARLSDPQADAAARDALARSVKDRAENLMIVDLMRNDLARVCRPGSIAARDLFAVESYANVHHLVSTVTGRLAEGRDVFDLLAGSFPPGSITGAPKPRAMEIIAELEGESRGPYCGALGWIGPDGAADFNVMIRTAALVRSGAEWRVEVRSGGAITIESDPRAELEETRAKAGALARAIGALS